jgi:hypothetical protein
MNRTLSPIAATLIMAAAAAALVAAAAHLPPAWIGRTTAVNLALLVGLAAYAALLTRLGGRGMGSLFGPIFILTSLLSVGGTPGGFAVPAAAALAWVRSGICFPGPIARRIPAEVVCGPAALLLIALILPPGPLGWVLGTWMFGLIQALYFGLFDIAEAARPGPMTAPGSPHHRAEVLLKEKKLERAFKELGL